MFGWGPRSDKSKITKTTQQIIDLKTNLTKFYTKKYWKNCFWSY